MGPGESIGKMPSRLIAMKRRLAYRETFINLKQKLPGSHITIHPSHIVLGMTFPSRQKE